ncbi:PspC domain-containing protein [Labilibacter sediminis]|nr:PspC domain-containing protein [Labilibacter sediminis]
MRKTVNINLSGRVFYIDDDAFARLRDYLDKLERYFKKQEEGQEIISDIESRIAELFGEKVSDKNGVVNLQMVEEVMSKMGQPEDFEGEFVESEEETIHAEYVNTKSRKRLYRDIDNRVLGGVCGGIAAYLNIDPVLVRIIFAILPFLSLGIVVPVYIILWIVVPAAITTAQKLEMRGENVTISNIEKAIRNEYEDVKQRFSKVRETKAYKKSESWWNRMTKRDKNIIAVIAIIGAAVLMGNLIHFNVFDPDFLHHTSFHMGYFSPFFHFPGIVILAFILLVIGFVFKSVFKIIIYLIAFLFLAVVGIKVIGFILGSVFMFC